MFRRGSSRAVSPKKEVRKMKSRDENTAPEVVNERPKPVKRASVKDIYDEHNLTEEEIKKRHEKLGYDPSQNAPPAPPHCVTTRRVVLDAKRDI